MCAKPVFINLMSVRSCLALGLLSICGVASALAQQQDMTSRLFRNPAELQPVTPQKAPGQSLLVLRAPSALAPQQDVTYDLNVNYTDTKIANPYFGGEDLVHLRSYNGSLIAPSISLYPSQSVRIRLHNQLPVEDTTDCPSPEGRVHSVPNCLSTTNLHFHGLHVSPTGNSDNVLLEHPPGQNFEYEVNVPVDHPAGTFWYHSHRHGSTAAQVSSGMVGALIVKGKRTLDDRPQNGGIADIDTILKNSGGGDLKENVLLLQQIAYACFDDPNSDTITTKLASGGKSVWYCPPGKSGEVKYYSTQFGPGSWRSSGHYTMITGKMQPQFGEWKPGEGEAIRAGEIQRWRIIHAGVRDTVALQIIKATDVDPALAAVPVGALEQSNWVDQHCKSGEVVQTWEFALDGLTRKRATAKMINILQPAYRSDVLIAFPSEGVFCVLDQSVQQSSVVNPGPGQKDTRLLALVRVTGGTPVQGDLKTYIVNSLIAADPTMPGTIAQQLRDDDLTAFAPNTDLSQQPIARTRDVSFNISFPVGAPLRFEVNGALYDPSRVDFKPVLGTTEDWNVTSTLAAHIFHIHVNPFQIMDIKDAKGASIFTADGRCTELDLKDKQGNPAPDPQYCDLKNVFRDTIFVKQNYHILLRTTYARYIGEYVLHCHILDHEDQGMMLNVEVVPNAASSVAVTRAATHAH
ncbi:L-ascorbate oxidase [Bradyrhizobium sp. cir1]|uniref:multicopper oxidase family protein n=1 Tax=Bradyrhizobium sp. cir1 TaxID=1445730 RepID=UPI0016062C6F|nr:multicopper oxidase domain-containing protein [Bradyrhizobium sp. cir1]MBB4373490.1 L-ascorbate oxidase [Bradyrhizobium sp. cir1]